jgi:hypothetical protein
MKGKGHLRSLEYSYCKPRQKDQLCIHSQIDERKWVQFYTVRRNTIAWLAGLYLEEVSLPDLIKIMVW